MPKEKLEESTADEDGLREIKLRSKGRPAIYTVKAGRVEKRQ